jgi:hypothetical protein
MIILLAAGAAANTSPCDLIDFEDELAVTGSRAEARKNTLTACQVLC